MRARTFVFALVCGTATVALAQDGGYVRFPAASPQACAVACASDQMCASWSYGTAARSYGQSQTRSESGGMCTFSGSSVVRSSPGMVSGLPRRESAGPIVPMMSAPPQQSGQGYPQQGSRQNGNGNSGDATGWGVRPAPWLNNGGGIPQQSAPQEQVRGMPQQLRPVPPMPTAAPSAGPRIEFEPQSQPAQPRYLPSPAAPPIINAPRQVAPTYVPPPVQSAPRYLPAVPVIAPPPPPNTQEVPTSADIQPIIAPAPRAARGVPKARVTPRQTIPPASANPPEAGASDEGVTVQLPTRPPAAAVAVTPATRRPAPARGTPRNMPASTAAAAAAPSAAAPPRQETATRAAAGRGAPRPPVRDPSNPESFRGADGMIDAAEMRRAQLNAAREQGTPAYSVQREWEAVENERQRAEAAGEVRVDPLAGTSPVPPPPETRAQKRAREAEEDEIAAEEARAASGSGNDDAEEEAAPAARRPAARGARGVPRPKAAPQTSQNGETQQVAQNASPRRSSTARRAPRQALDREPRLSGGPG